MSLISFIEPAGERLFDGKPCAAPSARASDPAQLTAGAGVGMSVTYDEASRAATAKGIAPDQAMQEKIALCCGNDELTLAEASPAYPPPRR